MFELYLSSFIRYYRRIASVQLYVVELNALIHPVGLGIVTTLCYGKPAPIEAHTSLITHTFLDNGMRNRDVLASAEQMFAAPAHC